MKYFVGNPVVGAIAAVAETVAMIATGFSSAALANCLLVFCRVSDDRCLHVSHGTRSDIAGHIDHNNVVPKTGLF